MKASGGNHLCLDHPLSLHLAIVVNCALASQFDFYCTDNPILALTDDAVYLTLTQSVSNL